MKMHILAWEVQFQMPFSLGSINNAAFHIQIAAQAVHQDRYRYQYTLVCRLHTQQNRYNAETKDDRTPKRHTMTLLRPTYGWKKDHLRWSRWVTERSQRTSCSAACSATSTRRFSNHR